MHSVKHSKITNNRTSSHVLADPLPSWKRVDVQKYMMHHTTTARHNWPSA
jgi:hypothetical protein